MQSPCDGPFEYDLKCNNRLPGDFHFIVDTHFHFLIFLKRIFSGNFRNVYVPTRFLPSLHTNQINSHLVLYITRIWLSLCYTSTKTY